MNVESFISNWLQKNGKSDLQTMFKEQREKYPNNSILRRGFAIEQNIETDTILFLGMNPSYKPGTDGGFYEEYGHWYFNRIKDVTNEVNKRMLTSFPFAHHDIFFVRDTSQARVLDMKAEMGDFFKTQMDISKELIAASHPKLIVVVNAGASKIFQNEMCVWRPSSPEQWNDELGVDYISVCEIRMPVLFTGMLSGQRALDDGSYYSLIWHICHILKAIL